MTERTRHHYDDPVDVIVIGVEGVGASHLSAMADEPGVRLAGVVDPSADRAQAAARMHGGVSWTTDLTEALTWPDVDACIATIAADPASIAGAGKHLLLDSHSASAGEATRLAKAFAQRGLVLMPGRPERFRDDATTVRSVITDVSFGEVVFIRLAIFDRSPVPWPGRLADLPVIEALDLVGWWLGEEPVSAYAQATPRGGAAGHLCVTLHHANGATAVCEIGPPPPGAPAFRDVFVLGSEGCLTIPWNEGASVQITGDHQEALDIDRRYLRQLRNWIGSIRHGTPPITSAQDSMRAVAAAQAVERSLTTGDIVPMDASGTEAP